jgi:hypothetical protein
VSSGSVSQSYTALIDLRLLSAYGRGFSSVCQYFDPLHADLSLVLVVADVIGVIKVMKPHHLTYSMQQSPSGEANRFAASQEIPPFYATRRFITAFTNFRHLSLS